MNLELSISRDNTLNGTPLLVNVNLADKTIRIDNNRVYIGGYINITGPHESEGGFSLCFVYEKKREHTLLEYVQRIKKVSSIAVEEKEEIDTPNVHILELQFPINAKIAITTYDLTTQKYTQ